MEKTSQFTQLVNAQLSRRRFLKATTMSGMLGLFSQHAIGQAIMNQAYLPSTQLSFKAIPASTADTIVVPEGYQWNVLVSWGQPIIKGTAEFNERDNTAIDQAGQFGDNNDGMSFFPFKQANGVIDPNRALMAINNEYYNIEYIFPHGIQHVLTIEDVKKTQAACGVSIIEVKKNEHHQWEIVKDSSYNRRITANTNAEIVGPLRGHDLLKSPINKDGIKVMGTLNNCSNGKTPWGTYLTCEENFNGFFGATSQFTADSRDKRYELSADAEQGREWHLFDERFDLNKNHNEAHTFGWVVEIDPFDPQSTPRKLTALGRFMHENAAVVVDKSKHIVVYMGDDARGEHIYKFVSKNKFDERHPDAPKNRTLLEEGTLYVAKYSDSDDKNSVGGPSGIGEWVALEHGKNGLTESHGFKSQAEVLMFARLAATTVGATTMDRPEWVAIHPTTGDIFVTLTNNKNRSPEKQAVNGPNPRNNNIYGHIIRMRIPNQDHLSHEFKWDLFLMADNPMINQGDKKTGTTNITPENMFNSPDGIGFDAAGRLWIETDGNYSNEGDFAGMGNNQMLIADPDTGEVKRFLTGPAACEITGLCFSPDYKTVFINVQHPGEGLIPSTFPHGQQGKIPRSSVIAISRLDGGIVGT